MTIRALEFYSGIGGLHRALQLSDVSAKVVRAFDWDQLACDVYASNYGDEIVSKADISKLSAEDLIPLDAPLWLLSPSCQPYTVLNSHAKGDDDPRAQSFLHLLNCVIPTLVQAGHAPRWMLVENVAGFEVSSAREALLRTLQEGGYLAMEFLLTPLQFGIPNSRLRYFLLAKLRPLKFQNVTCNYWRDDPCLTWRNIPGHGEPFLDSRGISTESYLPFNRVETYLEKISIEDDHLYRIPDRVLWKRGRLFDIVLPSSRRTCCFTRGYRHMVERSGSILQMNEALNTTEVFDRFLTEQAASNDIGPVANKPPIDILYPLQLRYFTPTELLALFGFTRPPTASNPCEESALHGAQLIDTCEKAFRWSSRISLKSKYKLIGNSVNVEVVRQLINYLFEGDGLESDASVYCT